MNRRRTNPREPAPLRRGKAFHRKVQKDWIENAEGHVGTESSMIKPDGRRGRMDVFVRSDRDVVAIAEIKATNWNVLSVTALKRNVRRQVRQIWKYIESQLNVGLDVCPGVVFPSRPHDPSRLRLIEALFEEEGIPAVWEDESITERKARS